MSAQRRLIRETLSRPGFHPTACEVYELVRSRMPRISLGTVYRNLDHLFAAGLIHKISGPGGARFDGNATPHHHVRCVSCGRIADVSADAVEVVDKTLGSVCEYRIMGYGIEFLGLCPRCRRLKKRPRGVVAAGALRGGIKHER